MKTFKAAKNQPEGLDKKLNPTLPKIVCNQRLYQRMFEVLQPITVYKKACIKGGHVIVTLEIPAGAKVHVSRIDPFTGSILHKCRASKAKVVGIETLDGTQCAGKINTVYSSHDYRFKYNVGATVTPKSPFYTGLSTCNSGIHFFFNKEQAADYHY